MHYYQHNIGDYRKDTSHLSLLEHGIYRQLLDSYYLDETPLCNDLAKLMRSHSVRNADEQQALQNVLTDFFELTEIGYIHKRCDDLIAQFHGKSAKARASANARWGTKKKVSKRKQSEGNANAMPTQSEGNANHKPGTINQEYKEAPKKASKLKEETLPEDWKNFCLKERPELEPKKVFESFKDYWTSVAGVKADWTATWRNWVRKETVSPTNKKSVATGSNLMKGVTYARS